MTPFQKPRRLGPGSRIAVLSPSWGGPAKYPRVFDRGLRMMQSEFRWEIVEFPSARTPDEVLHRNPKLRADDLNRAFADPSIDGIVASIGGDDSVRILKYLDLETIRANPKVFMGFSDTTTMLVRLHTQGLVTFNGPSVMAGFGQIDRLPAAFRRHIRDVLIEPRDEIELTPYEWWTEGFADWGSPNNDGELLAIEHEKIGWQWIQGGSKVSGRLFGGNIEVLEFLKSTDYWMAPEFWDGKIVFLETSEEKPTVSNVKYFLRNYGVQGVFDRIAGLLVGRPVSYSMEEKQELAGVIKSVVDVEFGRPDLPVVANLDFGHTYPQWILPLGIECEIDCDRKRIRLTEPAVV
jgi:muramoyltetrapeptide carboxypeptidase LdcA involved in peptidoglycan recycling